MNFSLDPQEDVAAGIRRVATEQIDRAVHQLSSAQPTPDDAVHSARKRFKRVRGLLRLVRADLGEETYALENVWYRDASRTLAPFRDHAAAAETVEALEDRYGTALPDMKPYRAWLAAYRDASKQTTGETLRAMHHLAMRVELARARIPNWNVGSDFGALQPGLVRTHRRARRFLRQARATPTDHVLHEWRKHVKYHWFHVLLVEHAWRGLLSGYAAEVKWLSDLLGAHHDLVEFERMFHENGSSDPNPMGSRGPELLEPVKPALEDRKVELEKQLLTLGERIFAEPSRQFGRRLAAYWSAGNHPAPARPSIEALEPSSDNMDHEPSDLPGASDEARAPKI